MQPDGARTATRAPRTAPWRPAAAAPRTALSARGRPSRGATKRRVTSSRLQQTRVRPHHLKTSRHSLLRHVTLTRQREVFSIIARRSILVLTELVAHLSPTHSLKDSVSEALRLLPHQMRFPLRDEKKRKKRKKKRRKKIRSSDGVILLPRDELQFLNFSRNLCSTN